MVHGARKGVAPGRLYGRKPVDHAINDSRSVQTTALYVASSQRLTAGRDAVTLNPVRYRVFITDFDGTLADQGRVAMSTWTRMADFRRSGGRIIVATGRRLDDLLDIFPLAGSLDAVVAEDGAVVHWAESGEIHFLAEPPPAEAIRWLRNKLPAAGIGQVIAAGMRDDLPVFEEWAAQFGLNLRFQLNKNSLMAVPAGIDKSTGVSRVLSRWGIDWEQTFGAGDAENDLPFLTRCALRATVANALPQVKLAAHFVAPSAASEGVQEILEHAMRS